MALPATVAAQAGAAQTALKMASTDNGCMIRVEGRGTMHESTAAKGVALHTLSGDERAAVYFDLNACEYLDSTFLGCIAELFRKFGKAESPRFHIVASELRHTALLGACRMDKVIPRVSEPPATHGAWITIPACKSEPGELTRHVIACHKALAEIDSPMRESFAKLAARLESELGQPNA